MQQRPSHIGQGAVDPKPADPGPDRSRIAYQQRLLQGSWDCDALGARLRRLLGLLRDNRRVIDANGADAIDALERQPA